MREKFKIYKCKTCENIIGIMEGNVSKINCCESNMVEVLPNTTDAATEKHVPVYEHVEDEIVVRVGEIEHPMEKEHYIMWLALVTQNRTIHVKLYPEQATETRFPYIKGSEIYAYCNKHGLWKAKVD